MRSPIITRTMRGTGLAEYETQIICVDDPPFCARADGRDDTAAVQAAIDACQHGGEIKFAKNKTYIVGDLAFTHSNIKFISESQQTILKKLATAQHMFTIGDHLGLTENISFIWLAFEGLSVDIGFDEPNHILDFYNLKNLLIYECAFREFEGDAILLNSASAATPVHNSLVTVEKCLFDGVNKENRNAISICDCDSAWIKNNHFTRGTKVTMPGPIDIESNNTSCVFKNINIIENRFEDNGAGGAEIQLYIDRVLTTPVQGINIQKNYFDCHNYTNGIVLIGNGDAAEATINMGINVCDNIVKESWLPIKLFGIKDALIEGNKFLESGTFAPVGYSDAGTKCMDIVFRDNVWWRIGYDNVGGGNGLTIYSIDRLTIKDDKFIDCGKEDGSTGYAIDFNTGTSSYVNIIRPIVVTPNALTTVVIYKEAGHTFTPATNIYCEGHTGGLPNYFQGVVSENLINTLDNTGTPSVALNLSLAQSYWLTGGVAAITDFDDGKTGQVITIIAEHALTITDGTNIFLNGSANWAMLVTDTLTLVCKADNKWYELSRSDNV